MSETGYNRDKGTANKHRVNAIDDYVRGKNIDSWRKTLRGVPVKGSDTRTVTSGDKQFTIGRYKMTDGLNLNDMRVFEMNVVRVADEVGQTVIRKQKDYGPNNIRRSPYGWMQGLTTRLYDKVARLANLSSKKGEPANESLRDTFIDIAGYGLIGLMLLDGTFPEE